MKHDHKNHHNGDVYSYLNDLERQEKIAIWELNNKTAEADKIQKRVTQKSYEEQTLKGCWESISTTNQLAKDVIESIKGNTSLVNRTVLNGELTAEAIKVLIIEAEELARKVLFMDKMMSKLKYNISELEPAPDPNGKIMVEINKVSQAIAVAIVSITENTIGKLLEVLQSAEVLTQYLGDKDQTYGISKSMIDLLKLIYIDNDTNSKIKFPRENCPKDFYDITEEEYNTAKIKLTKLLEILAKVKEQKALLQAKKDAVTKSKTAAMAAHGC